MTDAVQMMLIKPEFTGIKQIKKQEDKKNRAGTALNLGLTAGATAIAAKNYEGAVELAGKLNTNDIIQAADKQAGKAKKAVAGIVNKLPGKTILNSVKTHVSDMVSTAKKSVDSMPKPVKIAAAVVTGAVALAHAHDAGKIKGKFEGYKGANELIDSVTNNVKELSGKIIDALTPDKKEAKVCDCGSCPACAK